MEFTEVAVTDLLTGLVAEALAANRPDMSVRYGQGRFVKGDPVFVVCTWSLPAEGGKERRSQEFIVAFSGEAVTNFATADEARLAKLKSAAIEAVRAQHQGFDAAGSLAYPFLCQIDYLGVK